MLSIILHLFLAFTNGISTSVDSMWVLTSSTLPPARTMPSLGNGQLALVPLSDTITINCLYNGNSWNSHRARLPNYANYLVAGESPISSEYRLDLREAIWSATHTFRGGLVELQQMVHRRHTRTVLTILSSSSALPAIFVELQQGEESEDLLLGERTELDIGENLLGIGRMWQRCGETKLVEFDLYQPTPSTVCVAWTEVGPDIQAGEPRVLLTVVESSLEELLQEVAEVTSQSLSALLDSHTEGWEYIWEEGVVMLEGEDEHLQRSVLAAQYYLYISLPFPKLSSRPLPDFCGLANGLLSQDYQGHSFWDTESWMFPALLLLQPKASRALLDYRLNRLEAARDYAASTGWSGVRFPWESAFTGGEVCPDWAAETRDNQHHISGDVSFAIRQYLAVTGDTSVFSEKANANGWEAEFEISGQSTGAIW